jgi:8-oxo-dGTP pyrophosphatase MutT (NUDIX family)
MQAGSQIRRRDVVAAFLLRKGRVYLSVRGGTQSWPDHWQNVGGGVEEGETALAAIVRETAEETGLRLPAARFVQIHRCPLRLPESDGQITTFVVELRGNEVPQNPEGKAGDWQLRTFREMLRLHPSVPGLKVAAASLSVYLRGISLKERKAE